jgi:putative inorganic carbon (hco3(-)) transporter
MPDSKSQIKLPDYPHIPTFVLLLFCGYVVIWYLQVGYRRPSLGDIRIEYLWAIGLSVFALMYTQSDTYRNPLMPYLFFYFLAIAIQVPLSQNPGYSQRVFIDRIIKFAFMAWFIITFVKSPRGLIFFLVTFMLVCMKMGQEGMVGQLTGGLVWQNQGVMRLHGATPMYKHPNSFSGMAVGILPFIIAFFHIANKWIKSFLLIQLAFAVIIILFTGSRTGWVATALLMMTVLIKSKKKLKALILVASVVLLAVQYVPEEYAKRFESIFTLEETEGRSAQTRLIILKDAWAVFVDNPVGVGVGAFPHVRKEYFGRVQDTHNLYLEVATNLGIQGVIVFFALIFKQLYTLKKLEESFNEKSSIVRKTLKDFYSDAFIRDIEICKATAKAVYYFILVRLFLGFFGMDLYEIYWWFASGLVIALYNINEKMKVL